MTTIGTVYGQPQLRSTNRSDGMKVCNIDLLSQKKNADGSIEVGQKRGVLFGAIGVQASALIKEGMKVALEGREQTRDFESASGDTVSTEEVVANGFKILPADYDETTVPAKTKAEDDDLPF